MDESRSVVRFDFAGCSYHPGSRKLINEEKQEYRLTSKCGGILKMLLDRYPSAVSLQKVRDELWPTEDINAEFKNKIRTHLWTLRKFLKKLNQSLTITQGGDELRIEFAEGVKLEKIYEGDEGDGDGKRAPGPAAGIMPRGAADEFRDREVEIAQITDLLLGNDLRAVNIYGRFGVGKTALACEVIARLQRARRIEGVIYLNGGTITLDQVHRHVSKLSGEEIELAPAPGGIDSGGTPIKQKINYLIEQLYDRRYLLLLDSLEEQMIEGRLIDADLNQFLDSFMGHKMSSRLLITSREPLVTSPDARIYMQETLLDQGLSPLEVAIEFFKSLDRTGSIGLNDIPKKLLRRIAEKTRGFPRALEYVANILYSQPALDLRKLLEKDELFDKAVIEKLGREAQESLQPEERVVMQALAVYGRPVPAEAVARMLLGRMSEAAADEKLNRLARGKYVMVDRERSIKFSIEEWDSKHSYSQIPAEGEHSLRQMHRRAALYYREKRRPADEWTDMAALEAPLAEFEHLIRAEDYEEAARLIDELDPKLSALGATQRVIMMRGLLGDNLPPRGRAVNLRFLGNAYLNAGKYNEALAYSRKALELARELGERWEEANAQIVVALSLYHLNLYPLAKKNYEEALEVASAAGFERVEVKILRHLGRLYRSLSLHREMFRHYERALKIAREIDDDLARCSALSGMGTAYAEMGRFDKAIKFHGDALAIARRKDFRRAEAVYLAQLAVALRGRGDYEAALDRFSRAREAARRLGDNVTEMQCLGGTGKIHIVRSDYEEALQSVDSALKIANELGTEGAQQHWRTCLAQIYLHENQLRSAFNAIKETDAQSTPWNDYRTALVKAIIMARRVSQRARGGGRARGDARGRARQAFEHARELSQRFLEDTRGHFAAQYALCLADCGLALLGAAEGRAALLKRARHSLRNALAKCRARGVLDDFSKLAEELAPLDATGELENIRTELKARA